MLISSKGDMAMSVLHRNDSVTMVMVISNYIIILKATIINLSPNSLHNQTVLPYRTVALAT